MLIRLLLISILSMNASKAALLQLCKNEDTSSLHAVTSCKEDEIPKQVIIKGTKTLYINPRLFKTRKERKKARAYLEEHLFPYVEINFRGFKKPKKNFRGIYVTKYNKAFIKTLSSGVLDFEDIEITNNEIIVNQALARINHKNLQFRILSFRLKVMLHEILHGLGIAHNKVPDSIMYMYGSITDKYFVSEETIEDLRSLYAKRNARR